MLSFGEQKVDKFGQTEAASVACEEPDTDNLEIALRRWTCFLSWTRTR